MVASSVAAEAVALERRLRDAGFGIARDCTIGEGTALVARRSDFRWRWAATRLHTFVTVLQMEDLDEATPETSTAAAQQYAIDHKGGLPRGLQTGSVTVAVFLVRAVRPEVRSWFTRPPTHRLAALRWPVLTEVENGETTSYTGDTFAGSFYHGYLRQLANEVIRPASSS